MSVERTRVIGARCCSNAVDEPVRATAKEEEGKAVKRKGCVKWSGHTARSDAEVLAAAAAAAAAAAVFFKKRGPPPHHPSKSQPRNSFKKLYYTSGSQRRVSVSL